MLYEYPTIKSLSINISENKHKKTQKTQFELLAKKFFQLNPQITNFECQQIGVIEAVLRNVVNIERLAIQLDTWMDFQGISEHLRKYSEQNQIKWFELSIRWKNAIVRDYEIVKSFNEVQPVHSLKSFLHDISNELSLLSQLKLVRNLVLLSVPYENGRTKELFTVLSKLPNLQDLTFILKRVKQWVFKDVVMEFVQNTLKMRRLSFKFCIATTFVFHPNDWVELNQRRASILHASPMVLQLDYRRLFRPGDYIFVKPTFIHPSTPVLYLQFTTLDGEREL